MLGIGQEVGVHGHGGGGVKMRGRSFAMEVDAPSHPVVRKLLDAITLKDRPFADVPAFLSS